MINLCNFTLIKKGEQTDIATIPVLTPELLRTCIEELMASESVRILAFFAMPFDSVRNSSLPYRLFAILLDASSHSLLAASAPVAYEYDSFTPTIPALHLFEREIAEQYGIIPKGHPWLKPVRFHKPAAPSRDAWGRPADATIEPAVTKNFELDGSAVHEVAVGPVHAGVIEPGHFRFQCLGEEVHHLEISLGYQHRGIERMFEGGPDQLSIHFAETAAGDTTAASASNYAAIVEALSSSHPSSDSLLMRRIMLELERMANHVGDLGALAGDVAYLPTASYCGRLRGEYLNMTAEIAGNRFGRNVIVPGGMKTGLSSEKAVKIRNWLMRSKRDLDIALDIMLDEATVLDRFERTGTVSAEDARAIGAVGVAARASGLAIDSRLDLATPNEKSEHHQFPFSFPTLPPVKGDVLSRIKIRRFEIDASHAWLCEVLQAVSSKPLTNVTPAPTKPLAPESIAVSVEEAWRGELVHIAVTDATGRFSRYKIVDPSFRNWFALALALRGEQISDFPICNKSFNLSYCGHDL